MKTQARLLSLILAIVMCLGMLVACGGNDPVSTDTTNSANVTDPVPDTSGTTTEGSDTTQAPDSTDGETTTDAPIEFKDTYVIQKVDDTTLNVTVTRPQNLGSTSPIINKQQYVSNLLKDYLGATAMLDTDWRKTEDSESFEILMGPTDHPEVAQIVDRCGYGEWMVQAVGNKIVVLGYTKEAMDAAGAHLAMIIKAGRNTADKTVTLKAEDINKKGSVDKQLNAVPVYTEGLFLTYYDAGLADVSRQCDELIINKTSLAEFNTYLEKLTANGYTVYNTNEVNNSKFATLNSAEYTINAGYYNYEKSVRITVEPKAPDYSLGGEYTKVTTSNIILLGVEPKRGDKGRVNGMSMVMRLEDGRFIVVDGSEDSTSLGGTVDSASNPKCYDNVDSLISLLKTQSKDYTKTPTVAAWFLTHDHGDHSHLLKMDYQRLIDNGIKVENIYASAYSEFETAKSGLSNERYQDVMSKVAPAFGADMHRPHPGQVITYANCKIEILYTLEAWADGKTDVDSTLGGYNHSSVLFKTTFTDSASGKSTSVFNTGDGSGQAMQIAMRTFGESVIKSDVAVATHHGYGSGNDTAIVSAVKMINAEISLFPRGSTGLNGASSCTGRASNLELVNRSKESFYAGKCGMYTIIPVPYINGTTTISSSTRLK